MSYNLVGIDSALKCISSNVGQNEKNQALHYLEQFQKSTDAWNICHESLSKTDPSLLEVNVFAAQTIRNKVTYDLAQLEGNILQFKDSLLNFLSLHSQKIIITQLSVALARLAIQHLQWINPISEIITYLNPYPAKLLGFLKILPEETLDIGSTPLTEDEFNSRTHELITTIREDVLKFLVSCIDNIKSQQQPNGSDITLEQVLRCLGSWSFEFSVDQLLTVQSLTSTIFETLMNGNEGPDNSFEAAVDCLTVLLKESRDSSNEELVLSLYQQLIILQTRLLPSLLLSDDANSEELDDDLMESMTRIFVEAAEAWTIFISKSPQTYQQLVAILLMLTSKNTDLDVVAYTFPFWFHLKQNLVLPRYQDSKIQYTPIFIELINCIITHLQYPLDHFSSKESEDKFKDFRYHMGDVLKDCTAVVGTAKTLTQPLIRINNAISKSSNWQTLEAPLFSLRTMANEISLSENKLLPQIFHILVNLPEHPKIRYAATLVLGRYTEWTAKHPNLLEIQLQYIFKGFEVAGANTEILTASSHSLMYFCIDCSELLSGYIDQLFDFFFNVQGALDIESQFELCQGLSAVLNKQPIDRSPPLFQKLIDDNLLKMSELIVGWQSDQSAYNNLIADKIDLLYAMFEELRPRYEYPQQGEEPLLPQIEFIWDFLKHLMIDLGANSDQVIVERVTKLIRRLFEKFHVFCEPILSSVVEILVQGYANTGLGSYLWCSGSIIVVFGDDESLPISPQLKAAVWQFALSQSETFFFNYKKIGKENLNNYYELVMDFFAMVSDLIMFYPKEFILSNDILGNVIDVALSSVTKLENYDAYIFILRCLDDIISWGFRTPPISTVALEFVPAEWRQQILEEVIIARGVHITVNLFTGLVSTFNANAHADAISCLVKTFRLATEFNNNDPSVCSGWIIQAIDQLGNVTQREKDNLCRSVIFGLSKRDYRKVREGIRTFISWYLRKNIDARCC